MWGNYQTEVNQTDFAQINRGLYGLKAHYGSPTQTSFGEQRIQVDAFAAEPGTAHQREEFRGTGGSVYFLQKQDLSIGSERMRIEVRDANSNIVLNARSLVYGDDYDIDYIQGRIILSQPLTSTVDDGFLVQDGTLSGNPAYLVAYYEYTPLVTDLDDGLFYGGRAQAWIGDFVRSEPVQWLTNQALLTESCLVQISRCA